ncbi:MAG: TadE/TadG family type IV pilus assembly protein [Propylenella sp.]
MTLRNIHRRLLESRDGNVALMFSLAFPVILAVAGLAIDSAGFYDQQARLQTVADSTALAVAKEMHLFLKNPDTLKESGVSRAEALLVETGLDDQPHSVEVRLDSKQGYAQVEIALQARSFLPVEMWGENPIRVRADARTFGEVRLCVLGLDEKAGDAVSLDTGALLTAPECAVQSNSTDPAGLSAHNGSILVSLFACTSGGYDGSPLSFLPPPETDCPILPDPLELRATPSVGGCDYLDVNLAVGTHSISPGTYCGGLKLTGTVEVTAEPGVYIMTGGELRVDNNATLVGDDVSFYFHDDPAVITFKDRAIIELSAPREGPMAGILFYENPAAPEDRSFEISSDAARKLLGTIYLPRGVFQGGGNGKIAALSAYTIIVAKRIDLDGAQLVVNADYSSSGVPVPVGLGPNTSKVRLSH